MTKTKITRVPLDSAESINAWRTRGILVPIYYKRNNKTYRVVRCSDSVKSAAYFLFPQNARAAANVRHDRRNQNIHYNPKEPSGFIRRIMAKDGYPIWIAYVPYRSKG